MLQICENIKQARVLKGYSQQEVADKMNIERGTYKNWEQNTEPALSIIKTISQVLGVPAHTLLAGVIDFTEKESQEQEETVNFQLKKSQVLKILSSLNVLDSAFAPAVRSSASKIQASEKLTMAPSGKRKDRQSTKK